MVGGGCSGRGTLDICYLAATTSNFLVFHQADCTPRVQPASVPHSEASPPPLQAHHAPPLGIRLPECKRGPPGRPLPHHRAHGPHRRLPSGPPGVAVLCPTPQCKANVGQGRRGSPAVQAPLTERVFQLQAQSVSSLFPAALQRCNVSNTLITDQRGDEGGGHSTPEPEAQPKCQKQKSNPVLNYKLSLQLPSP